LFAVDELIVYGATGVCRVQEICRTDWGGDRLYYLLSPLYQDGVIYAPVEGGKVQMRPVIGAEEANAIIDRIPTITAEAYYNPSSQQLAEHYQQAMQRFSCEDLVMLTMSIYHKKQDVESRRRKFGQVDQRFLKKAEDMLFGEFAVALGIAREEVGDYIAARLKSE